MARQLIDLTGQRFGKLIVLERAENHVRPNGQIDVQWRCLCDCGNERICIGTELKRGGITSCGCNKYEKSVGLEGQRFGKLTAIKMIQPGKKDHMTRYLCQCDCGNQIIARTATLKNGRTTHCGCVRREATNIPNLVGQKFGMLTVMSRTDNHKWDLAWWMCKCDCGNIKEVNTNCLTRGTVKSCGCLNATRNGESKLRIYGIWRNMLDRCEKSDTTGYKNYGGRGITVCEEWHDFNNFKIWAFNNGYDENGFGMQSSIDRIDVNGNYCPENCRWANAKIQANNKRTNHYITLDNETHTLTEWAELYNLKPQTIYDRMKRGWSEKDAIMTPVKINKTEVA